MNDAELVPRSDASSALVPREPARRAAASSTSLVVESAHGSLHATLAFVRRHRMRVEFSLDVVNAGDEQLLATIYARTRRGDEVPVEPVAVWIGARTEAYVTLALGELGAFSTQTLVVRLQGPNVHRVLEAGVPPLRGPLWGFLGGLVAALVILGAGHVRAQIENLTVPSIITSGTQAMWQYRTRNARSLIWELDDANQHKIDGGSLRDAAGSVQFHVPPGTQLAQYSLTLRATGIFGSDQSRQTFAALPMETPVPKTDLRISSLSVDNATPPDGGRVTIRYSANARSGVVRLVDAQQVVWSSAPLSQAGVTTLALPFFGHAKELQAQVIATNGTQRMQAGVGIVVTPNAPADSTALATVNPGPATPVVVIATSSVRAGGSISIAIAQHVDELQVALVDSKGRTIAAQSERGDIGIVHMHVPAAVRSSVAVVVTYTIGKSQASVIRRVLITQ